MCRYNLHDRVETLKRKLSGGKVIKMEVDYSETVAKKIPEAKKLAESNLNEALEMLINLEKQVFLLVIQKY